MWGWLDSVVNGLASIIEGVSSLANTIISGIGDFFSTLFGRLTDIINSIVQVGKDIISGICDFFTALIVPDTEYINQRFNDTTSSISSKFGFEDYDLADMFKNESPVSDVSSRYKIPGLGTMNLIFFNSKYLIDGVDYFRPFIRGFIVLLLVFFNIRSWLSFIGHDSGSVAGMLSSSNNKEVPGQMEWNL